MVSYSVALAVYILLLCINLEIYIYLLYKKLLLELIILKAKDFGVFLKIQLGYF